MSEITVRTYSPLYPHTRNERHLVDPVAFVLAMVGGPVVVAVTCFWLVFIPVFALILGGPLYVIVGTPVLLWELAHREPSVGRISMLALVSLVAVVGIFGAAGLLSGDSRGVTAAMTFGMFGIVFAPIWGAVTGAL